MTQFDISIDTLRRPDGTYREPSYGLVRRAVDCGHTAHLQTELGTVAFRPYSIPEIRINKRTGEPFFPGEQVGENILVEFYPKGAGPHDSIRTYTGDMAKATLTAYAHLTGRPHKYRAGQHVQVYSNQAMRDGVVLAVRGWEVLVEYEMPGTTNGRETSALVVYRALGDGLGHLRNYSHRRLPKCWIEAMHRQGTTDWIGMGQRELSPVPFPSI